MRKRIGSKVIILLGILCLIFIFFSLANVTALSQIRDSTADVTEIYMELEKIEGKMSVNVQEFKGNMETSKLQVQGVDYTKDKVSQIQAYLEQMEALCKQTGDRSLNESFGNYKREFETYMSLGVDAATALEKGDQLGALTALGDNRKKLVTLESSKEAYSAAMAAKIDSITGEFDSKIAITYVFNIVMIVVFMLMVCVIVLIVMRTIASPARKASGHLNQIVKKLQNDEGDLTERIEVKTQDEVGQLAGGVNRFIEQLQGLMRKLKGQSERMMDSVEHITTRINSSNESVTSVSA